jgi:hypothetical protein
MSQRDKRTDLKPVERITMITRTENVALSPVAILTIARARRMKLNGFAIAENKRLSAVGPRSLENILGPCLSKAERAASVDKPLGLEPGSRLFGVN